MPSRSVKPAPSFESNASSNHRSAKDRSPNLSPDRLSIVVDIIRGWDGRLTWPALVDAVATRLGATYTRQALHNRAEIRAAYDAYRAIGQRPVAVSRQLSPVLRACVDRNHRLELANAELRKREAYLLEQFVRWAYNASSRGLTAEFLDQPLPRTARRPG